MTIHIADPKVKYLYNRMKEIRRLSNGDNANPLDWNWPKPQIEKIYDVAQRAIKKIEKEAY